MLPARAMNDSKINSLNDLRKIRSAPLLDKIQKETLLNELASNIADADWFTVGIMAKSSNQAILVLKEVESYFDWPAMKVASKPEGNGPVFLKNSLSVAKMII